MSEQISARSLKKVSLFTGLTESELAEIAKLCQEKSYQAGECCLTIGEKTEAVHFVQKGRVGVETQIPDAPTGRKDVILAALGPGEVFSWSALMGKIPTASVRAIESAKVISIDADTLIALCESNSRIGYVVMKNLASIISSRLKRHRLALLSAVSGIGEGW